jgi:hypothetical protein
VHHMQPFFSCNFLYGFHPQEHGIRYVLAFSIIVFL